MSEAELNQGAGYGVVVGVGLGLAVGMIVVTGALKRYQAEEMDSEEFATAGRSIKSGLISSAVVSSWTWCASLLQSTTEVYKYGISGAFYYAAGATVQIILFATLALELKAKCPNAHTYLEIIKNRYGTAAHCIYMVFGVITNILVTAMLFTGGASVINYLTGMSNTAACFLLPVGVVIFTLRGGIKATFYCDFTNTAILLGLIFGFMFYQYASPDSFLGSPSKVYDVMTELGKQNPIEGNAEGSLLTLRSQGGGMFFVINLAGNFGTVFLDNGYWNKAISAQPRAALPGYFLGGLAWFAIPFTCATTLGLACRAGEHVGAIRHLTDYEVTAGLALPNGAISLLGSTGAAMALVLLFMTIMSASSAELVSISSIATFDIYKTYVNPNASPKQLMIVTYSSVVGFGLSMAALSTGLYYAGIGMGYLYLLMGVIISAAVLPVVLSLCWSWQSKWAVCCTPILGLCCGLTAWLTTCYSKHGELTIKTTGEDLPMMAGNVTSLCSPLIFSPLITFIKPQRFDFKKLMNLETARKEEDPPEPLPHGYLKVARYICVFVTLSFLILWPMPMYGSSYVFSKKFFTGWVVVGFIWLFYTFARIVIWPLWESREGIASTFRGVWYDISGQRHKNAKAQVLVGEGTSSSENVSDKDESEVENGLVNKK